MARQTSGAPAKRKKKAQDAPKGAEADEEELRLQVRKTLWQAAISGRLENIFPKVLEATEHSGMATPRTIESTTATSSDLAEQDGPVLADASLVSSPGSIAGGVPTSEIDLEALRCQARQTFCEAMFSGKLDKVLGQAKSKANANVAEPSASAGNIKNEVRATLEKASCNGRLDEVLAKHQASRLRQQGQPNGRLVQNRRDRHLEKVEDTRDLEQLLLELGETPAHRVAKSKKKAKKIASMRGSNIVAGTPLVQQDKAAQLAEDESKQIAQPNHAIQEQAVHLEKLQSASLPDHPKVDKTVPRALGEDSWKDSGRQLLEGWQVVTPKAFQRDCHKQDVTKGFPARLPPKGVQKQAATPGCEISATSESWAQLVSPSPAMEPISRKTPTEPTSLALHRPALAEAPTLKMQVPRVQRATSGSKRRGLPPPPSGSPPAPPQPGGQNSAVPSVGCEVKGVQLIRFPDAGPSPAEPLRSIPIWPSTPESTPPNSPRDVWEPNEVLVPIPIHLLADVQRLLAAAVRPQACMTPMVTFGDLPTAL